MGLKGPPLEVFTLAVVQFAALPVENLAFAALGVVMPRFAVLTPKVLPLGAVFLVAPAPGVLRFAVLRSVLQFYSFVLVHQCSFRFGTLVSVFSRVLSPLLVVFAREAPKA